MMHREFACVFISQYPKQPLQHGRDEDEGGTPSHHTAAGIESHNSCLFSGDVYHQFRIFAKIT